MKYRKGIGSNNIIPTLRITKSPIGLYDPP